ncbi:hypothetical protein SAMN04487948_11636 [Halogranum amylolyticum]|uniref:Uncharacterized protein n=1 Tax=Halogranum amylolyticum TaxID=660520 RepID=A0A1H8VEK5_9EURY|nr:hypothetical protein [Halogranum amylolyticum]SEP13886.1 hypothetical protein SAMN04487948_11636 [Halogranum amylolyticum]
MSDSDDGGDAEPSDESESAEQIELRDYEGWQVLASAGIALVVTVLTFWWISGFGSFYETLFRVGPTVPGGGVGADWVTGNTIPTLDFLIALIHALDVILGLFVLFLVFLHWTVFRRLAGRMRRPGTAREEAVMTDGGDGRSAGGENP